MLNIIYKSGSQIAFQTIELYEDICDLKALVSIEMLIRSHCGVFL